MLNLTQATTVDQIATQAANIAMGAAADFCRVNNYTTVDLDLLVNALRARTKAAILPAFDDAREAIACGMADAATATFTASMKLAGIQAAKDVCITAGRAIKR